LPSDMRVYRFTFQCPRRSHSNEICFSFGFRKPIEPLMNCYYPLFNVNTPGPERRKRVHGEGHFSFNLEGFSTFKKLEEVVQRFARQPLTKIGPTLDWGCGCGRLTRFLSCIVDLFGADIDAD